MSAPSPNQHSKGIPRGLARTGPVLFSYGFRPFFLGGAIWAVLAMALWILALAGHGTPGGAYGAREWHMHEMLFGFAPAIMCGFLMTAIPNWTGRMPLSGRPLMALAVLWLAGRLAFTWAAAFLFWPALLIEALFLPIMAVVFGVEIIAGKKWRDLKVVGVVALLAVANLTFHALVIKGADPAPASRAAVAGFIVLILIIGGRITPSFTRNWLNRRGEKRLPTPFGQFDSAVAMASALVLALWVITPEGRLLAIAASVVAVLNLVRLLRWRGWLTLAEPLVLALHGGYLMVVLGFAAIAVAAMGWLSAAAALHVFAVGAIGFEMLAVMGRATRGHTGRELTAGPLTVASYIAIVVAAILRPLAELVPASYNAMLTLAGMAWIVAFGLYVVEYAPALLMRRRDPRG